MAEPAKVTFTLPLLEAEYLAASMRGEFEDMGHLMENGGARTKALAESLERQFKRQVGRKVRRL